MRTYRYQAVRRLVAGAVAVAAIIMPLVAPGATPYARAAVGSVPLPPFTECPAVGSSPSCKILLVVNSDGTVSVYSDGNVGDYDGGDDTLVGIWNQSSTLVNAVTVSGAGSSLAGFDGDGLCTYGVTGCPFGSTGYEGPGTSFVTDPSNLDAAEVAFAGGLAPNATTYFSLEGTLTDASLTARQGHLSALQVSTQVIDFPSWVDPTQDPLVDLRIKVTNGDGTPAGGASLTLSNTHVTFTTKPDGTLTLAERVGLAVNPKVTVQATSGTETASTTANLFNVNVMTECHLPGVPNRLSALTPLIDFALPQAPPGQLGRIAGHIYDWLGAVNNAKDLKFGDSETTVLRGYEYTGSFNSPIYQLQFQVDNTKTGAVVQSFPDTFSRQYALVKGLFNPDGLPIQQIGRSLMCGVPA